MKRYIIMLTLAAMLTGCTPSSEVSVPENNIESAEEHTVEETTESGEETAEAEDTEELSEELSEEAEEDIPVSGEEYKLSGINDNTINFFTKQQTSKEPNKAVLSDEQAKEIIDMINAAPKEIGCTNSDDNLWFKDGETRVYMETYSDGSTYANVYADQKFSAELTTQQKDRINEIILDASGIDINS